MGIVSKNGKKENLKILQKSVNIFVNVEKLLYGLANYIDINQSVNKYLKKINPINKLKWLNIIPKDKINNFHLDCIKTKIFLNL